VSTEEYIAVFAGIQALILAGTLIYVAMQLRDARRATGFQAYSHVDAAYMRHLWLAADRPELNAIWEPADPSRKRTLDEAQRAATTQWGAWRAMHDDEKLAYRYTRAALAIFEEAWEVHRRKWIADDTWSAWTEWLNTWKPTPYYRYVIEDNRRRLRKDFYDFLEEPATACEGEPTEALSAAPPS
jgi:hypothetical protein